MISRYHLITLAYRRQDDNESLLYFPHKHAVKLTMIVHHYGGSIHVFLLQDPYFTFISYFSLAQNERKQIKMCDVCMKTHIMCFWLCSQQNFSSYLNNRSGQFAMDFQEKNIILTVKCSNRDEAGRSYFPNTVIHVK